MAVTTKKLFPATSNATTSVFSPVGIQLNNQDDLDVYVTLSGGTRVLQLRQSTGSTAQSSHPQVNNTDGLYFPAVSAGTTLYNYQLSTDNNTITFNSALPQGAVVFCERRTRDADSSYTSFASGSTIRATDLNNSSTESNFTAQDGRNKALTLEGVLFRGDQPSTNFVTTDHIVAGTIVTNDISNDSVTADKIPDDTINSEHYVDGSIDTQHISNLNITTALIAADAVNTTKIADLNVTRAKIENDAIDGTKLADNAVDSEHYVDGSIDEAHFSTGCVTGTKIANDAVDSQHIAAGALDNEHYAAGSITSDKLNGATVVTASEQAAAASNDTSFLTTAAADARFFNVSTGDTIKDGDSFPDNDTTIATTAAINDRIIDLVDDVGGFVPIANETSFPAANPDVNNGAGTVVSVSAASTNLAPSGTTVTIANGAGTGNTVTITGVSSTIPSGFGFLVETTSTLHTYTFHRLSPKSTEVTTVASNATEIGTVHTNINNINTVAGISSDVTAVKNIASDVTAVKNIASNVTAVANDATDIGIVAADGTDIGLVAGSINNVNTVAGSITSVNNAQANLTSINNFGDQYQVASNNPSTDGGGNALAAGDLYFNTSANELKVYNGSSWQGGVTASGNFASITGNTFTGDNTYNDNVKAQFGTSADGLEIYHDGTDSIINDNGTGDLYIKRAGVLKMRFMGSATYVYGNLGTNGTVDGRDVAADGTKLDLMDLNASALTLSGTYPVIKMVDTTSGAQDYRINIIDGIFKIQDNTDPSNVLDRFSILTSGDTTITGSLGMAGTGNITIPDSTASTNNRLKIGSGNDLQIYHGSDNSWIRDLGSGNLYLDTSGSRISLVSDGSESTGSMAKFNKDGAVELFHDGGRRFQTQAEGVEVYGAEGGNAVVYLFADEGDDDTDKIRLLAGNGTGFYLQNKGTGSWVTNLKAAHDGNIELYHQGNKMLETTSTGVKISNGNRVLNIKQGTNSNYINLAAENTSGGDAYMDINSYGLAIKTDGDNRLQIANDGTVTISQNLDANGGLDVTGATTFSAVPTVGGVSLVRTSDTIANATEAANVTAVANNSTNASYRIPFLTAATGTAQLQTDSTTGPSYNPFLNRIYSGSFQGNLIGDVTGDVNGDLTGTATTANEVNTQASSSNSTKHLTFVSSNGNSPTSQGLNTVASVSVNPSTGVLSATSFAGDGSNLTGISSLTLNSNADNRLITGGTGNNMHAEPTLTFDGQTLQATDTTNGARLHLRGQSPQLFFDCTSGGNGSVYLDGHDFRIYPNQPSSAGTERVRIKSNGNIGINETNPQQLLHVHNDTSYQGMLINGNGAPRVAYARSTTTTGEWSTGIDGTNGTYFVINNSNDNSNRRVIVRPDGIDLGGTMNVPSQPAFHAYNNGSTFSWNNGTVPFNATLFDVGSNYNTSNYRYTVPRAGKYIFIAVFRAGGGFGEFSWLLQKNGTTVNRVVAQGSFAGNDMQHGTVIVSAAANDYFTIYGTGSHGGATGGSGRSSFFGYLLG